MCSRRHRALLLLLLVSGAGACSPAGPTLEEKTSGESITVEVNAKAPAFAAATLEGKTVKLADFVGSHVVLIEFWSIFCKSCIQEMPHVEALFRRYGGEGLSVLSVNTDVFSSAKVASFLQRANISPPYPVLRDPRQEIVSAFQVELLPVTVILDREGWIRLYQEGYRPGDEKRFERLIRRLLGKEARGDVTLASRGGVTTFAPAGSSLAAVGQKVGGLEGRTVEGESMQIDPGRPRLLFFWSLYCQPCRAEHGAMEDLARRYRKAGLASYAINVDSDRLTSRVRRFAGEHPDIPCILDLGGASGRTIAQETGVRSTPTVILLDADGEVVHAKAGATDRAALEEKIRELVTRD